MKALLGRFLLLSSAVSESSKPEASLMSSFVGHLLLPTLCSGGFKNFLFVLKFLKFHCDLSRGGAFNSFSLGMCWTFLICKLGF